MRYIMHGESAVEPEIESESSSPQNPTEPTEIKKVIITGLVKRTDPRPQSICQRTSRSPALPHRESARRLP